MRTQLLSIPLPHVNNSGHSPRYLGGQPRLATCTGVTFISENELVATSLVGQMLYFISFDVERAAYAILSETRTQAEGRFVSTDLVDSRPSGDLVTSNCADNSISLYATRDGEIAYVRNIALGSQRRTFCHAARFVPGHDGVICVATSNVERYVAFISESDGRELFRIEHDDWKAKDICFPQPGRLIVIFSQGSPTGAANAGYDAKIVLYELDVASSSYAILSSLILDACHVDSCVAQNGVVFVTNGTTGTLLLFDVSAHTITHRGVMEGYDVPHGIAVHPSGALLAVTDYVRNSVEISRLPGNG